MTYQMLLLLAMCRISALEPAAPASGLFWQNLALTKFLAGFDGYSKTAVHADCLQLKIMKLV